MLSGNREKALLVALAAVLFAYFPLTDTDIWWHLACAREWVVTWTPVRMPVVNVHEFFQMMVAFAYGLGGAVFLVAFKALLWGCVFALFLRGALKNWIDVCVAVVLIFVFRYQLEMRPVVFSLLFLGIYWNVIPWLVKSDNSSKKRWLIAIGILCLQWIWCRCQGLYVLGPIFALSVVAVYFDWKNLNRCVLTGVFVMALFGMPFLHRDGVLLATYPFELLNRLAGLSPSAAIFAKEIAENRSPLTLLMEGENFWTSLLMIACLVSGLVYSVKQFAGMVKVKTLRDGKRLLKLAVLCTTAILALLAERNFVLFLPVFLVVLSQNVIPGISKTVVPNAFKVVNSKSPVPQYTALVIFMFVLGLWGKSLTAYDATMVSYQRVPVAAAEWMKAHPHNGHLFNDDRAGGYLAFVNPSDSTYIDGRFMLKTADFFERYLSYAYSPELFLNDAQTQNVDRVVLPIRYYARWNLLIMALSRQNSEDCLIRGCWTLSYRDDFFIVFDKK